MSGNGNEGNKGPEQLFRELRDRPTPELGSQELWARVEAGLEPRSARDDAVPVGISRWRRLLGARGGGDAPAGASAGPSLGWAYALAGIVVLVGAAWIGVTLLQTAEPAELVVLNNPEAPPVATGSPTQPTAGVEDPIADPSTRPVRLDVRLILAYDGPPPEEVEAAAVLGVGGADALVDVRAEIDALLAYEDFGILGQWSGRLEAGQPLRAELSGDYGLSAASARWAAGDGATVRLENVELSGVGRQLVAADLNLELGRNYILGVRSGDAGAPSLILVVRVELEEPAGEAR